MIITNCPRCGSMNVTTTCTKCGWSQLNKSTVSTGVLLDDYKRLLLENRNLKERVAELEEIDRMRSESVSTLNQANANNEDEIELLEKRIAELEALLDELKPYRAYDYP